MRITISELIVAAAVFFCAAASASAQATIDKPQWVEQPTADDLVTFYPDKALVSRTSGAVTLDCEVKRDGRLAKCAPVSESPGGLQFAKNAEQASVLFRLAKPPVSGQAPHVQVALNFKPPSFDTAPKLTSGLSVEGLAAVWPTAAHGEPGRAFIRCILSQAGTLKACKPAFEDPEDKGFGAAAVLISSKLVYKPALIGGRPTETPILVSIKWEGVGQTGDPLRIVQNSVWAEAPTLAQVMAAYPKAALVRNESGRVVLRCKVGFSGQLKDCDTVSETPDGHSFGSAAQKLASAFRTPPLEGADPKVLPRIRVELPIIFEPPTSGIRALTKVRWTLQPDPNVVFAAFPEKAADAHVETGKAVLDCTVGLRGAFSDCKPIAEDPPGMGFGEAAAPIGRQLAISPWTDEGAPTDGAHVVFTMRFVHKEPPADAAPPAPAAAR